MDIQSAFASGTQGLQSASYGITEATVNINRETTNQQRLLNAREDVAVQQASADRVTLSSESQVPSLTQSLVQLNTEQINAEANVRSIQTADEVLGSVIDIRV
ncbi:excinuclease ATPase subunit [Rheinheimera sp.]|uniref:excinuclease ATPase subunit n=1 Tax=Rheinheimera sp. TaxID=1869214 RepID=UPI0027B9B6CC|nr:excinuclease ATPase subunit [Rheinheimera sp.]